MDELEKLTQLCLRVGAPTEAQAQIMAKQLMKRAEQLVTERSITREAAMQHLLTLLIQRDAPTGGEL